MSPSLDLLLQGGTVVDGSGRAAYRADVAVAGGRIVAVGSLEGAKAGERLDVRGLAVCPGFIDIHSHSDTPLLVDGRGLSKLHQGVTTEVIGNCGSSPAPLTDATAALGRQLHAHVGRAVTELSWDWRRFGDFLDRLESGGLGLNVIPLAGHTTLRAVGMGFERRPPSEAELAGMKRLLAEALDDGAWGFSSGLIYQPSGCAETDELVALAQVAAERGGFYFSHIRGEGAALFTAVAEACEIGERAGLPVQIAHLKPSGRPYWGRVGEALGMIDRANERGLDIAFDVYPYTAGSMSLTALLAPWALEGGRERLLERLRDPASRARLAEAGPPQARSYADTVVATVRGAANKLLEGLSVAQIAERRGVAPPEALFDLLLEEQAEVRAIFYQIDEADLRQALAHPRAMVGSDGRAIDLDGPLSEGKPHPRCYGAFPRVLGHYARDEGLLSQEEAVYKMSGRPAERLGLRTKGRVAPGFDADLVVYDPLVVNERGTYTDPRQIPVGLPHVIVNGQLAIQDGRYTGALAGRVLRFSSRER